MATAYKTPGVYIEEISIFPPSIAQVETAIPAFIGYTEKSIDKKGRDLKLKPTRIKSLLEYEELFGKALPEDKVTVAFTEVMDGGKRVSLNATAALKETDRKPFAMYYAMRLFYANGGGPCYIISTGLFEDSTGTDTTPSKADLLKGLDELKKEDEPTLIVFPDGPGLGATDYYGIQKEAIGQSAELGDRFAVMDIKTDESGEVTAVNSETDAVAVFRNTIGTNDLKYGAAYFPPLVTDIEYEVDEAKVTFTGITVSGTGVDLADLNDPSNADYDTQAYNVAKKAIEKLEMVLPATPAVVGVYCYVDRTRGVWKAPANVSLDRVLRPWIKITHEDQESLNIDSTGGKSVNAIRSFTGRGILVWGARTLAGNDNEWRYVPVRRFFNMVEESTKKATAQFVFEPNDANTWVKVRAMIENFLLLQWRAGALAGAKPEQAFYVKVGLSETMTALDILEGRMIVEIGMAVVRPAEFIILRFMHKMQES